MADRAQKESKIAAGLEAIAAYEAEFGVITDEAMAERRRLDDEAVAAPSAPRPRGAIIRV